MLARILRTGIVVLKMSLEDEERRLVPQRGYALLIVSGQLHTDGPLRAGGSLEYRETQTGSPRGALRNDFRNGNESSFQVLCVAT